MPVLMDNLPPKATSPRLGGRIPLSPMAAVQLAIMEHDQLAIFSLMGIQFDHVHPLSQCKAKARKAGSASTICRSAGEAVVGRPITRPYSLSTRRVIGRSAPPTTG